jgi:hypothetical protein
MGSPPLPMMAPLHSSPSDCLRIDKYAAYAEHIPKFQNSKPLSILLAWCDDQIDDKGLIGSFGCGRDSDINTR